MLKDRNRKLLFDNVYVPVNPIPFEKKRPLVFAHWGGRFNEPNFRMSKPSGLTIYKGRRNITVVMSKATARRLILFYREIGTFGTAPNQIMQVTNHYVRKRNLRNFDEECKVAWFLSNEDMNKYMYCVCGNINQYSLVFILLYLMTILHLFITTNYDTKIEHHTIDKSFFSKTIIKFVLLSYFSFCSMLYRMLCYLLRNRYLFGDFLKIFLVATVGNQDRGLTFMLKHDSQETFCVQTSLKTPQIKQNSISFSWFRSSGGSSWIPRSLMRTWKLYGSTRELD